MNPAAPPAPPPASPAPVSAPASQPPSPTAGERLKAELRALVTPGPRMVDELECVASIMLAILFANLIGAKMVAWAAFTAFVLIRGDASETLLRALLRMVGTVAGAGLALLLVPRIATSPVESALAAAIIGTAGLYGTLTARRAYAWLLFALTFEMILLDKLDRPAIDVFELSHTRLLEVAAGTVACLIVSLLSHVTARRRWPAPATPAPTPLGWHPHAARHAAQAGIVLGLMPLLEAVVPIPELSQAGVTVLAVMIVPATSLGVSGLAPVTRRLVLRMLGCAAGGGLAATILVLADGSAPVLIAGTCLGVIMGRHIENGFASVNYLGLQFTLAVLVVLVPDSYAAASLQPGLNRLLSIFVGMALLLPVLLAWHYAIPRRPQAPATTDSLPSE